MSDPNLQELLEVIGRSSDPDDKLTITLGNFNRVRAERDAALAELEALREAARDGLWWLDAWLDATEDEPDEPQRVKLLASANRLRAIIEEAGLDAV